MPEVQCTKYTALYNISRCRVQSRYCRDSHSDQSGLYKACSAWKSTFLNEDYNFVFYFFSANTSKKEALKEIVLTRCTPMQKHLCCFCYEKKKQSVLITKPLKHFLLKHKAEKDVKKAKVENDKNGNSKTLKLLRIRADHLHNLEVIKNNRGQLRVLLPPDSEEKKVVPFDFLPCYLCKVRSYLQIQSK